MRAIYNRVLASVCALLLIGGLQAQEAKRIEYFFDTDPGYGQATPLAAATGDNSYSIPVDELPVGVHLLCLRAQDDKGVWSSVFTRTIYVMADKPMAFARMEYFFDADPGYGQATPLAAVAGENSYSIPVDGLPVGAHQLCLRAQDDKGVWSSVFTRTIYVMADKPTAFARMEYFIDSDPGYGKAQSVDAPAEGEKAYSISLDGVSVGAHLLSLRGQDNAGNWSALWSRLFYHYSLPDITQVEYYIDNDPGCGNATQVQLVPSTAQEYELTFNVNLDTVSIGEHNLCVRAKDALGHWSTVSIDPFTVTEADGVSKVTWSQPIVVSYAAGLCRLTRGSEATEECNVQVMTLNGTTVATTRWNAGSTTLDIPVSVANGTILLIHVAGQEKGLRTVRRVLVK